MSELELEIGRFFGGSSFFLYQVIKHNPKSSLKDLQIETGLSDRSLKDLLRYLTDSNIITRERVFLRYTKGFIYSSNDAKETWSLH